MKLYTLVTIVTALFALVNIGTTSAKEIYHNVDYNNNDHVTTVSLYEGENEKNLVPLRKYIINYSDQGFSLKKIVYLWNQENTKWILSDRYEYLYSIEQKLEGFTHSEWNFSANHWGDENQYAVYYFDIDKELLTANIY